MIARIVSASLRRRFRQLALILAAVTVAAATVAALAGFSARTQDRLGESLAAFGPNLTVRPQVGGPVNLPVDMVERVREVPGVRTASGVRNTGDVVPASGDGAQKLLWVDRIEVRAEPGKLDEVASAIESRVEGVEAVPLRRVSESDALLTKRLTLLLAAV